jgi:hypothetical protein
VEDFTGSDDVSADLPGRLDPRNLAYSGTHHKSRFVHETSYALNFPVSSTAVYPSAGGRKFTLLPPLFPFKD